MLRNWQVNSFSSQGYYGGFVKKIDSVLKCFFIFLCSPLSKNITNIFMAIYLLRTINILFEQKYAFDYTYHFMPINFGHVSILYRSSI